jgi:hypothetical protein
MAYRITHLEHPTVENVLAILEEQPNIVFIQDIIYALKDAGYLRMSWGTFYKLFPKDGDDYLTIVDALEVNKTAVKYAIRKMWLDSNNPTTQIALYKLLATQEERDALRGSNPDNSLGEDKVITLTLD